MKPGRSLAPAGGLGTIGRLATLGRLAASSHVPRNGLPHAGPTTVALLLACSAAAPVRADHPAVAFGTGIAGPVVTIPAAPYPARSWSVGVRLEVVDFDAFTGAELAQLAARGEDVHAVDALVSPFFSLSYGVTGDFGVGMRLPFVRRTGIREVHADEGAEPGAPETSQGVGDATLLGHYRVFRRARGRVQAALLFGLKLPTGTTDEVDVHGERFETEHQPGSGSWDALAGAAFGLQRGAVALDTSLLAVLVTEGTQGTDLGDALQYNAAVSFRRRAGARFDVCGVLEANAEWRREHATAGLHDPNSGGTLIAVAPGLRLRAGERWTAYLSAGIPIIQNLSGHQHETHLRTIAGFAVKL